MLDNKILVRKSALERKRMFESVVCKRPSIKERVLERGHRRDSKGN